jgi:hypothetical protein
VNRKKRLKKGNEDGFPGVKLHTDLVRKVGDTDAIDNGSERHGCGRNEHKREKVKKRFFWDAEFVFIC